MATDDLLPSSFQYLKVGTGVYRTNISSMDEINAWIKEYSELSGTSWVRKLTINKLQRLNCRKKFICKYSNVHKTPPAKIKAPARTRATLNCRATIDIKIKLITKSTTCKDQHVKAGLPAILRFENVHTHEFNIAPFMALQSQSEIPLVATDTVIFNSINTKEDFLTRRDDQKLIENYEALLSNEDLLPYVDLLKQKVGQVKYTKPEKLKIKRRIESISCKEDIMKLFVETSSSPPPKDDTKPPTVKKPYVRKRKSKNPPANDDTKPPTVRKCKSKNPPANDDTKSPTVKEPCVKKHKSSEKSIPMNMYYIYRSE